MAETDVALQSALGNATLEGMDARMMERTELQEQLAAKDAALSGLLSQNAEFSDELRRVKAQNAAYLRSWIIWSRLRVAVNVLQNVQRYRVRAKTRLLRHLRRHHQRYWMSGKTMKIVGKR